jgi:hypothetical protein
MGKVRFISISLIAALLTMVTVPSFVKAEDRIMTAYPYSRGNENQMEIIFMDTFYGMAAGALIATAISLTQDKPDWGKNLGTGAAIGGLGGAAFGIATEMHYLSSIENGKVYVSVPSIEVTKADRAGDTLMYTAGLFRYKF